MASNIWTPEEEARRLAQRFAGLNQAKFARDHLVPGGASMVSQHIKGRRPISLEAALAYARGFGVPLEEISPRLSAQTQHAAATLHSELGVDGVGPAGPMVPHGAPSLSQALEVVLGALRALPRNVRTGMTSDWVALLAAPDSAELHQWLTQALQAQEPTASSEANTSSRFQESLHKIAK